MIDILVTSGVGVISTAISSYVTWVLTRKKYNSEVKNSEILNMEAALLFYTKLNDDTNSRLDLVLERNNKLEEELNDLRKQMLDLSLKICLNLTCQQRIFGPTGFDNCNSKNTEHIKEE